MTALLAFALTLMASAAAAEPEAPAQAILQAAPGALCPAGITEPEAIAPDLAGALAGFELAEVSDQGDFGLWARREIRLENTAEDLTLRVTATRRSGDLRRVVFEVHRLTDERPLMVALLDGDCRVQHSRALRYGTTGPASELVHYDADLTTVTAVEPLNPPVPAGEDPGGVTVAHIDSGVNYLLPEIAARLARDGEGKVLGADLWDGDARPYDGDLGRSPFFPIRHGTPVASLLIAEAPEVRLLPIRYPRPDMTRMAEAVRLAAAAGAGIVALPMGSRKPADW
ncbi:MAG: S8 family peptidase, partial [Proteobacteria bacterium]|nr:S8 family peptidase [Pseudomonadota bacterium]